MTDIRGFFFKNIRLFLFLFMAVIAFGHTSSSHSAYSEPSPGNYQAASETQAPSTELASEGDPERGQRLFMGYIHFQNGGPPCMGCHSVGGNGILGGGVIGPDLTNSASKLNQSYIAAIIANTGRITSPVMKPIFADHSLTDNEQADLMAFLVFSAGQPETNHELPILGISLGGLIAAAFLIGLVYRGRLRGVRKSLINKAVSKNKFISSPKL